MVFNFQITLTGVAESDKAYILHRKAYLSTWEINWERFMCKLHRLFMLCYKYQ